MATGKQTDFLWRLQQRLEGSDDPEQKALGQRIRDRRNKVRPLDTVEASALIDRAKAALGMGS